MSALGFQCRPLFTACFWGRSGEGRSAGVTAQHGWATAVNTLPGSRPAPPPVNHSCPWKKFIPGQPVPTAALKTAQGGEGGGLETPPITPMGSPPEDPSHPWCRSCPPRCLWGRSRPHRQPHASFPTRVPSWPVLCREHCAARSPQATCRGKLIKSALPISASDWLRTFLISLNFTGLFSK